MSALCYSCRAGFHGECIEPVPHPTGSFQICCCFSEPTMIGVPSVTPLDTRRAAKADEDVKDQTSTGRKRAAALYPIPSVEAGGMICEWAWLANAGGGAVPIVGCRGNTIADIKTTINSDPVVFPGNVHHGPDKSTLNNELGNVHRVCPVCHNRWHSLNDPLYSPIRPDAGQPHMPLSGSFLSHDAVTKATPSELDYSDAYWELPNRHRGKVPYRLEAS